MKRKYDAEGADDDVKKIRENWFTDPYFYRFGASVILFEDNSGYVIRLMDRGTPNDIRVVESVTKFLKPPGFKHVHPKTLRNLVLAIAHGQANESELDAKIFRLYGRD